MFTILLHSSKTMRQRREVTRSYQSPTLLSKANELAGYVQSLTTRQLETSMKISPAMATKTYELWQQWTDEPSRQIPAIDVFIGDIYSGLQVQDFTDADRTYANEHLYILSGLYGALRALDDIHPYRLEMGYRLPDEPYKNLYTFWGNDIATALPHGTTIINLSTIEYTKAVFPHVPDRQVIAPKFLTREPKSRQPKFVTVHAKIARGAFAHWLITRRIEKVEDLKLFDELGYEFDAELSTADTPVFVCQEFQGLGLSVRLT